MLKPAKLLGPAIGIAASVGLTLPVSSEPAKQPKQKNPVATQNTQRPNPSFRGPEQPYGGGLYYQGYYLGDDPDPFIRLQIMRDLSARFPGNQ